MQLTVRMPDEYQSKLAELTREMGLKRSDIVRMARIWQWLIYLIRSPAILTAPR